MNETLTLGSLFDGSGGFPLGGLLHGITPLWASEIEPFPIRVTTKRLPNMKHYGDVSRLCGAELPPVDIITFGSPCQDMSIAGKRAGLDGERSGLFYEAVRIVKEMRCKTDGKYPRFVVWENVQGAFSSNKGEDFRCVLEALSQVKDSAATIPKPQNGKWNGSGSVVGDGYSIAWRTLDAQYWGVPQRRKRIYLVADFRGECAQEILFKRESLRGYFEAGRTPWQGIAADAQNCVGTAIGGVDRYNQSFLPGLAQTLRAPGGGDCTPTVLAPVAVYCHQGNGIDRAGKCLTAYSFDSLSSNSMKSKNPHSGCRAVEIAKTLDTGYPDPSKNQGGIAIVEKIILDDQGGQQISVCTDGKSPTLRAEAHGNAPYVINKKTLVYDTRGNGAGETVPTITGDHNNRVTDYTCLAITRCYDIGEARLRTPSEYIEKSPTITARCGTGGNNVPGVVYCLQGNGIDRADTAGCNGKGWKEDTSYTLNTIDKPAVVCAQKSYTEFKDESTLSTLKATGGSYGGGSENIVVKNYIVRRLTPTECARLQGFPSWWGIVNPVENLTDEDYAFWLDVRNTYAEINGKATKEYTREQMLAWYNKLHSDSAEYKMWGNGIALPNALYVMQGIAAEAEIPINLF